MLHPVKSESSAKQMQLSEQFQSNTTFRRTSFSSSYHEARAIAHARVHTHANSQEQRESARASITVNRAIARAKQELRYLNCNGAESHILLS